MPPTPESPIITSTPSEPAPAVCPVCHLPLLPSYYFCPNCGFKLSTPPLSVTPATQAWIYALSIILPIILYLGISHWPANRYLKSNDPKTKLIGQIAWGLMIASTIFTLWLAYVWTEDAIQSSIASINTDFSP